MGPAQAAAQSYVDGWLRAEPEWRVARVFLAAARMPRFEAWLAFEHALRETVWHVRDAGVAQAKLGWWLEEIGHARAGSARHPLLQRLAAVQALDAFDAGGAERILRGAARASALESPADVESLLAAFMALEQPLAEARTRVGAGAGTHDDCLRALAAARVLLECRHWERFALPQRARLPLDLLARTGTPRDSAPAQAAPLRAALAGALLPRIDAALAGSGLAVLDAATLLIGRCAGARHRRESHTLAAFRLSFALWRLGRRQAGG